VGPACCRASRAAEAHAGCETRARGRSPSCPISRWS
jgi:hypothetical protein